jgi:hypothetical protein
LAEEQTALEIEVQVDGIPLRLVPFVRDMLAGAVVGMITTLRGAENAREIEIRVRRRS